MVSTMECFYIFLLWSVLPFVFPSTQNIVLLISSAILQLVFLPLIMTGQNLLSKNTEARAEQDHNAVMEAVTDLRKLLTEEDQEMSALEDIKTRFSNIDETFKRIEQKNDELLVSADRLLKLVSKD